MSFLKKIDSPKDLKKIDKNNLKPLCAEIRDFIIKNNQKNGGHFGSNLGTVELTVALHKVFSMPKDDIIWDVGHQAYTHKILTGRYKDFHTNRNMGGISGFPKPSESKYDSFISGHASISISAILGMATASRLKGEKNNNIAVIGDGAMTGGIAFEGLNNAGNLKENILIILNDNKIAIDENVGALKDTFTKITTSGFYNNFRKKIKSFLRKIKFFGFNAEKFFSDLEHNIKSLILKKNSFFDSLGFRYFGPIDGHDVENLIYILEKIKDIPGPKVLHIITKKGKGFSLAEENQTKRHATKGEKKEENNGLVKYQDIFGETILKLAEKNEKIVGISPAMLSGSSLNIMMKKIPERVFDVGIAEQHALTFSAGLASKGMTVFCTIYSTFLQRAYDQIIHDICIEKLPVIFCIDRAGVAGEDGPTHHGVFDIAFLRCIPNMTISAPMNEKELVNLMYTAQLENNGPFAIRYPKGNGVFQKQKFDFEKIEIGKGKQIIKGEKIAILSVGTIGNTVLRVCKKLNEKNIFPSFYNMIFIKPMDEKLLKHVFENYEKIITVEDSSKKGGFGSGVLEFASENGFKSNVKIIGLDDVFVEHGNIKDLEKKYGLSDECIFQKIIKYNE